MKKEEYVPSTPGATSLRGGGGGGTRRGRGGTVHVRTHLALAEVRRNIGSATRGGGRRGRRMLRFIEGEVSHLQAVGHFCGRKLVRSDVDATREFDR